MPAAVTGRVSGSADLMSSPAQMAYLSWSTSLVRSAAFLIRLALIRRASTLTAHFDSPTMPAQRRLVVQARPVPAVSGADQAAGSARSDDAVRQMTD
jgi:hypothetical protein